MAITIQPLTLGNALKIISDADSDGTSENNVNDGAATVYGIDIDNVAAATTYFKAWNAAVPTVGTTAPDLIIGPLAASTRRTVVISGGLSFATALSFASVTTAGTAGTTNPASDVVVEIVVA